MAEPLVNTLIDGRYRVLSRLGAGGMADVFLAEDQQLGRKLALKLLHRRFAEDPDFVERFRREAQAAAGLAHPNVVSVYDRGEYDDTYYIAMEYLPGRSLKQLIRQEAPLEPIRAIDITIQILKAARFAHRRGVIHRDLKPHNVIVDDADIAKVTDFGIARAGASDMTETGSIMGTAQYLSPEQAQGLPVSPGSDLYSVGIVLYEMLTGRVPFDAESPVTIALKHISEPPLPPRAINPAIPPELEQTILWVLNKNPADRPVDADQLITVLEHCREALTSAGEGQHTASMAAVAAAGAAAGAGAAIAGGALAADPTTNGSGEMAAVAAPPESGSRRWVPWALAALVLLLVAGAAAAAYFLTRPNQSLVPKVTGEQLRLARKTIEAQGFEVDSIHVANRRPPGTVIGESPDPGTKADKGSTITLTVSGGPGKVSIPTVLGLSQAAATRMLRRAGLKVAHVVTQPSGRFVAGEATGTNPGVTRSVARGTPVTLFISSGPATVQVPNVTGDSQTAATAELTRAGFNVNQRNQASSSVAVGNVIDQDPGAGVSAPPGSTVTIVVAVAPPTTTVPSVTGDTVSGATSALRSAGLGVTQTTRTVTDSARNGIVVGQSPGAGATVKKGSTVTIIVGQFVSTSSTTSSTTTSTTSSSTTSPNTSSSTSTTSSKSSPAP